MIVSFIKMRNLQAIMQIMVAYVSRTKNSLGIKSCFGRVDAPDFLR